MPSRCLWRSAVSGGAAADLFHRLGGVQDERDLIGAETRDAQEMARLQRRRGRSLDEVPLGNAWPIRGSRNHGSPSMTTSSIPSISWRRTWTLCLSDVGRFFPT